MKFIKWLAWIILCLFIVIPALIYGLVATTSGSVWLLNQAANIANYKLSYTRISGSLIDALRITDGVIHNDSVRIEAGNIELAWQPYSLLNEQLIFTKVIGENIYIILPPAEAELANKPAIQPPAISLPIQLKIEQLITREVNLKTGDSNQRLPDIHAQFGWFKQQLNIVRLNVEYEGVAATINGAAKTAGDYPLNLNVNWSLSELLPNSNIEPALGSIIGQATVNGNLRELSLDTQFKLANASQYQHLNLKVRDVFGDLKWLGKVNLTDFAVRPILGLAVDLDNRWRQFLSNTTIDLSATVESSQLMVESLTVNLNDNQQGRLNASGTSTNYLAALSAPESAQLTLSLTGSSLELPADIAGTDVRIDTLQMEANGSFSNIHHRLKLSGDIAQYADAQINSYGTANLHRISVEQLTIKSKEINGELRGESTWQDEVIAELEVIDLVAALPQLSEYNKAELKADGHLSYKNKQLRSDEFEITWADSQVHLVGAMREDDPLRVSIDVPQLDAFALNTYLTGSIKANFEIVGTLDHKIQVFVKNLNLNHPDFGEWQSSETGLLNIPVDTPMAFSATDICMVSNNRRTPAKLCASTDNNRSTQTTSITGTALPLSLANRFRTTAVAERIWGLANLNAQLSYELPTFRLLNTSGRIHSEQTVLFALDEEVSTRFEYWEAEWNGDLEQLNGGVIAELESNEGTLIGDIIITDPLGTAKLDGEILLDVQDLTVLQWVLPDLRYENAQAVGEITISGTKSSPQIEGSVELAAQEIGFAQTGLVLTNVRVAAFDNSTNDDTITLNGQAESGDGWIAIKGDIQPLLPTLNLEITGENFRAAQLPNLVIDVSPSIAIKLANKRIDISGELTIPNALIDQPEIQNSAVTPSDDVTIYENGEKLTPTAGSTYPVYANVRVSLGDNVKVKASGFDGRLGGSIRVIEAPNRALTATGSIQVKEGFYELYGQRLEIDRGSLIYSGGPIGNPGLDLRVVRAKENMITTENISVGAQINGTIREPDFRLFSSPAMPDSEILSYLILGRGSGTSTTGNENLQLQALLLLGSKGTDILGESLQDTFGFDEFGLDSSMNPNDTSFYVGKYLSPKLYVKYGVGLFENTNTFLIRYLLSEHFIIETTTSGEAQGGDIFYTIEK